MFLAHTNNPLPRLYQRSDWIPPERLINYNLKERMVAFRQQIHTLFRKQRSRSNLLPHQRRILSEFCHNKTLIVFSADKNLGPCVIERSQYIHRALTDHLLDKQTYQRLHPIIAHQKIEDVRNKLNSFIAY